jgi:hypothetical protein
MICPLQNGACEIFTLRIREHYIFITRLTFINSQKIAVKSTILSIKGDFLMPFVSELTQPHINIKSLATDSYLR